MSERIISATIPMTDKDPTVQILARILEKIEILINVTSIQVGSDKSLTERARLLKVAGLDNHTIADVLNTSAATIRTLTSNLRGAKGRR